MFSLGWPGLHRLVRMWTDGIVEGILDLGPADPFQPGCAPYCLLGSGQDTSLSSHPLSYNLNRKTPKTQDYKD